MEVLKVILCYDCICLLPLTLLMHRDRQKTRMLLSVGGSGHFCLISDLAKHWSCITQ